MKITFLGTAAYEGYPNPFCECPNCKDERENGRGRFRATAIIDNDLLIDFGPDIVTSAQKFKLSFSSIKSLLITHAHEDHLYLPNFDLRKKDFNGSCDKLPELEVICPGDVGKIISDSMYFKDSRSKIRTVLPFEKVKSGEYEVIAFPANHRISETDFGLIYTISKGSKTIFYATDTGPIKGEYLKRLRDIIENKIDILVMDATLGYSNINYPYHNSFTSFHETLEIFRNCDILAPEAKVIAHHFSHHNNPSQKDLEFAYGKTGVMVAFDGMEAEI